MSTGRNLPLDFINNYTSLIHGHAHPAIDAAVRQLRAASAFGVADESEIALAELLAAVPSSGSASPIRAPKR